MQDLIDRQAAIDAIDKALSRTFTEPCGEMILKDVSSAQPEITRCKDCIHNDQCKHRVVMWVEDPINTWHKDIDFCSYGERKKQENE